MQRANLAGLLTILSAAMMGASPALAVDPVTDGDATTQPATQPTTESIRAENRKLIDDEFNPLPKLPAAKIADILQIKIDGGHLHVTALLPPTDDSSVPLSDWPGATRVNVGPRGTLTFRFKHVILLDDGLTTQNTEVYTLPDYLQIVRDTESQSGVHSVTLLQSRQFAGPNETPIRLMIQDNPSDGLDSKHQVNADSFDKLRQADTADVRRELLPILQDLGAADLLQSVSLDAAWQVLGPDVQPDAQLDKQIDAALADLTSDDFATRTKADAALNALGPAAAADLVERDLTGLQTDPRAAVDNFIHRAQKLDGPTAGKMRRDPEFLINAAGSNFDPRLTEAALKRLHSVTGKSLTLPANLSPAERQAKIDAFRAEVLPTTRP